ncbi:hypothetical protein ACES2J_01710 [Bdellovibrio bacteriovorus]|uniref:hypothetical protein n=1 Tax=Bdellovibrio bacteriovorus TaxID=959 RepID=UPI0035A5C606
MMSKRMYAGIWGLFLALMLSSCKTPVSFAEEFSSKTSEETTTTDDSTSDGSSDDSTDDSETVPDSEVVGEVCDQLDSDSHNASQGDIMQDPFLNMSFASGKGLVLPQGPCLKRTVKEDSDVRREILYEYSCREVKGTVNLISTREEENGAVVSVVDTDVDVYGKTGSIRNIQSTHTHMRLTSGAIQIDREFEETSTVEGVQHQVTGVSFYDFIPDEDSAKGAGFVQISGNVSHLRGGVTQNVYSVSSDGLHRAVCGFDDGVVTMRSSEKITTVTYSGCGKPAITQANAEVVEGF